MTRKFTLSREVAKRNVALSVALAATVAGTGIASAYAAGAHSSTHKVAVRATGTVTYSDWQFPDTLNPYQTTLAVSTETLNGVFDGLFKYDNHAKVIPWMATEVPSLKNGGISKNGKTITVHLKKGLQFSNGSPITSANIKFGWQVDMNKATGPACSGTCDNVSRIDTPNKYTAVFHMKTVYAPAVPNAVGVDIWPTSWPNGWTRGDVNGAANKLGQDSAFNFENSSYPTDGAYKVSNFVSNDRIVLTPNKHYHTFTNGGQIANLIFAFYSSKPGMEAAAANKQTDVTQDYTAADLPDLSRQAGAFKIDSVTGFIFEHLEFNVDPTFNGQPNPLSNVKVRQALALALDKYGLIESALGVTRKQASNMIAWTPWVNTPTLVQPFTDKTINGNWDPIQKKYVIPGVGKALTDARKLLAGTPCASGCTIAFDTTSGNPTRANQEAVIAASWKKIGVNVTPNFIPASKFFGNWDGGGTLDHGQYQVGMFAFLGGPEPDSFKYELQSRYIDRLANLHASLNENYSGVKNATIDKAFNTGAHSFNSKVRAAAYKTVQQQLNRNVYWDALFFRPAIATTDGKVKNFSNNPTQTGPTWNMSLWTTRKTTR